MNRIKAEWAALNNKAAIDRLLKPIPNSDLLLESLNARAGGFRREPMFQPETHTAWFVICDDRVMGIFTVTEITVEQAKRIWAACDAIREWSTDAFVDAVFRAIGGNIKRVQ